MLKAASDTWPVVEQTFTEASNILGYDLWDVCQNGPVEELNQTMVTQPALLTASIALWRQWFIAGGGEPDYLAGHSLGEYSALVAAESLDFADALRLVRLRGELMQTAVPAGEGGMAAILGLEDDQVIAACDEAAEGDVVSAVNFNAPGQVVIAGNTAAVERAIALCKERGARKAMALPVSVPSHCSLMRGAADELAKALADVNFGNALTPVVQNVTAELVQDADQLKVNLLKQLYSPVRWTDSVQLLVEEGVTVAAECGAGKVLAGLAKRIDRSLKVVSIETPEGLDEALEAFRKD